MSSLVKRISSSGGGDVIGPGSSNDNSIVRFDGSDGTIIQDSTITISDVGDLDMATGKITSLGTPTSSNDAATKAYADAIVSGLSPKVSCVVATTGSLSTTYSGTPNFKLTATSNGAISIDGVSLSLNDRVLVKNQSTGSENGIYYVSTVGDGSNPYVLTRATDFDESSESLSGTYTFITSGSTNSTTGFILTTTGTITLDTTSLTFTQFSAATAYIAGDGMSLTGLTFNVGAGTGITVSADTVSVDTTLVATTTNVLSMSNKTLTSPVLTTPSVTGGTAGSVLFYGSSGVISQDNSNLFWDNTKKFLGIGIAVPLTNIDVLQANTASGSPAIARFQGGAHTTLAASTEANDVYLNLTRTVQFSTGALTTQRAVYITAPTYAFVGASTLTTAATLCVASSPTAGTNATITRSYSIMSENGNVCFTMNSNAALTVDFLGSNTANSSRTVTFKGALGASSSSTDFTFNTANTRTAGNIFSISSNSISRLTVAHNGNTTLTQAATTSSSPVALTVVGGAHTALTASVESTDIYFSLTRTVEFSTGAITNQRSVLVSPPAYGFVGASTITNACLVFLDGAPSCGTNATFTNTSILSVGGSATLTSTSGLTYSGITVPQHTVTITGSTSMTSSQGCSGISIGQITYTGSSAATITNASSLYIANSPAGGGAGPVSISNAYSIFVDSGISRFDGSVYMGKGADIASAGDLTLGSDGNTFVITGTTTINAISAKMIAGTVYHLIFSGALIVKHNTAGGAGTAKIFLNLSLDLTTAANTVLTLVYDGTQFQEVCRKVA